MGIAAEAGHRVGQPCGRFDFLDGVFEFCTDEFEQALEFVLGFLVHSIRIEVAFFGAFQRLSVELGQ